MGNYKRKYWTVLRDKKAVETCRSVAQIQLKLLITKIYDHLLSVQLYSILIELASFVLYHYHADFRSNQHYPAAAVGRGKSERASFYFRPISCFSVSLCWRNKVHTVRFWSWSHCLSVCRISGHLPKVALDPVMCQGDITGRVSCACHSPG